MSREIWERVLESYSDVVDHFLADLRHADGQETVPLEEEELIDLLNRQFYLMKHDDLNLERMLRDQLLSKGYSVESVGAALHSLKEEVRHRIYQVFQSRTRTDTIPPNEHWAAECLLGKHYEVLFQYCRYIDE